MFRERLKNWSEGKGFRSDKEWERGHLNWKAMKSMEKFMKDRFNKRWDSKEKVWKESKEKVWKEPKF